MKIVDMSIEDAADCLCSDVNQLLKDIKLLDASKYSNFSSDEIKLITNHPLLEKLDLNKITEIKSIIINSLKNIK